ncbi:MAG: hypothetical protein IJX04_07765 [Oscillospiraceae bacterium]|nr:hypothetical protein [Oscillospiraceae bacterium]
MNYYNELPVDTMDDEALMIFLGIYLVILGVVLVCCLVGWVLRSMSLHSIAKRRGIRNAWMAWIPIGSEWVLGSVADQYQHLVKGKITSRRKILMLLTVATGVAAVAYIAAAAVIGIQIEVEGRTDINPLVMIIPYLLVMGTVVSRLVFYHICNYDLYRSCRPNGATAFLVLGIIFPVCEPFFYLSCRNKDLGMVVPEPVAPAAPVELPKANPEF